MEEQLARNSPRNKLMDMSTLEYIIREELNIILKQEQQKRKKIISFKDDHLTEDAAEEFRAYEKRKKVTDKEIEDILKDLEGTDEHGKFLASLARGEIYEPPEEEETEAEKERDEEPEEKFSLKKINKANINVAINQLKSRGISAEKLAEKFDEIITKLSVAPGGFGKKFIEEDAPVLIKIRDEITKILSGNFSNLIKESESKNFYINSFIYAIITEVANLK